MQHEREQQPNPLTIDQVTSIAKEALLRDGYHTPTVIAEGSNENILIQIAKLGPTPEVRQMQMFQAGFALAESGTIDILQQVFCISEGWLSQVRPGELPSQPPSQDPNRKEVLIVANFNLQTGEDKVAVVEMVRDQTGKLTELKESDKERAKVTSPLLSAFITGFVSQLIDLNG